MQCSIYKSSKKSEHYLFIEKADNLDKVPEQLQGILGELELVMELDITPERKLALSDAQEVLKQIEEKGFYLQMPPEGDFFNEKAN